MQDDNHAHTPAASEWGSLSCGGTRAVCRLGITIPAAIQYPASACCGVVRGEPTGLAGALPLLLHPPLPWGSPAPARLGPLTHMDVIQVGVNVAGSRKKKHLCQCPWQGHGPRPVPVRCTKCMCVRVAQNTEL